MTGTPKVVPHILVNKRVQAEEFRGRAGGSPAAPARNRASHATHLTQQLATVAQIWKDAIRQEALQVGPQGRYVDVTGASKDILNRIELPSQGIEVTSVKGSDGNVTATIYIPDNRIKHFEDRVTAYATKHTAKGNPKYAGLVNLIEGFSAADVKSALVGVRPDEIETETEKWWEVWVRAGHIEDLRTLATRLALTVSPRILHFPDREIALVHASLAQLQTIWDNSSTIAEIRLYRDTPGPLVMLSNDEQVEWVQEAARRVTPADLGSKTALLVLDSGVNRAHPLLDPFIPPNACLAWDKTWPVSDTDWNGHGTAMAGLALHGDLADLLLSTGLEKAFCHLESARILPPSVQNDPELYGRITQESIRAMEKARPDQNRVVCLAVTAREDLFRGRPTAWSAALDQIAAGEDEKESKARLLIVSAGNNEPATEDLISDYMLSADTAQIHSPAQAWNVVTVGAYTERTTLNDAKYKRWSPVAPAGDLAPTSSTSVTWEPQWPLKPDVVFEGGNIIVDGAKQQLPHADVRLLTTSDHMSAEHVRDFGDTSGAAALAARMAAQLMTEHPTLRPETIRALMVHSADWTNAMRARQQGSRRRDVGVLVKRYGHGVPSLNRALHSLSNEVTLVIEDTLQPFTWAGGKDQLHQMHLHQLPWQALNIDGLNGIPVEMRVTLSYFIEPNPSERSYARRFRYASHGFRFAVKGPLESEAAFRARVLSEEAEEGDIVDPANEKWLLGPSLRNQGSLHSDTWEGDISELRECNFLAIYPVSGWWRGKRSHVARQGRYSLLVTLRVPDVEIDLYTPIATALGVAVTTSATVEV